MNRNYAFVLGWFGGCWTDGDYPAIVKDTLGSLLDNYIFTQEEKDMIKGSCDFYAIDASQDILQPRYQMVQQAVQRIKAIPISPNARGPLLSQQMASRLARQQTMA